jgi:hypothetical protein
MKPLRGSKTLRQAIDHPRMHNAATMPVNTSSQTPLTGIWLLGRMNYVIGMNATVPTAAAASSASALTTLFIGGFYTLSRSR